MKCFIVLEHMADHLFFLEVDPEACATPVAGVRRIAKEVCSCEANSLTALALDHDAFGAPSVNPTEWHLFELVMALEVLGDPCFAPSYSSCGKWRLGALGYQHHSVTPFSALSPDEPLAGFLWPDLPSLLFRRPLDSLSSDQDDFIRWLICYEVATLFFSRRFNLDLSGPGDPGLEEPLRATSGG
jgi:hypothetical protein